MGFGQQAHWATTYDANPDMYGTDPSVPALAAAEAFVAAGFELIDVSDFTEGELPRRLSRVTMRVPQG